MRLARVGVVGASTVVAAVLLAGCTSSSSGSSTPTASGATGSPTATATVTATATASSTAGAGDTGASNTTPPAVSTGSAQAGSGPGLCTPTVTRLSIGAGPSGDNHVSVAVHVANASSTPCTTTGYPGVALLDAKGNQIEQAQRTPSGYAGGLAAGASPAQLVLQPGEEATALVEGLNGNTDGQPCGTSPAFLFTLPDNTDSTTFTQTLQVCEGLQVHPLVRGSSGSQTS